MKPWILISVISVLQFFSVSVLGYRWDIPTLKEFLAEKGEDTDGIKVRFARHINGWRRINHISNAPIHMIQGDVMMAPKRRIPVLAYPPQKELRIDFRKWLTVVGKFNKGVKINLLENEVVTFALNHAFAMKQYLRGPVWIHADIVQGPNAELSATDLVDADNFIKSCKKIFPYATLSVGWQSQNLPPLAEQKDYSYTWRNVLDMLDWTYESSQEVNFVFRAVFVQQSLTQILWLFHTRPSFTVTVWLDDTDTMECGWDGVVKLRQLVSDKDRLYFDIPSQPFAQFRQKLNEAPPPYSDIFDTPWNRSDWRVVQFGNSDSQLSTVIKSDLSVAFVGAPTALMLSLKHFSSGFVNATQPPAQMVSGRIHFIPESQPNTLYLASSRSAGLSVYLVPSAEDLSPDIEGGVQVYIGEDGTIFIEDRTNSSLKKYERPKSGTQHSLSDCYGFEIWDFGTSIELSVTVTEACAGRPKKSLPNSGEVKKLSLKIPERRKTENRDSDLNPNSARYVILQKSGEAPVDFIVEHLVHSSAKVAISSIFVVAFFLCVYFASQYR